MSLVRLGLDIRLNASDAAKFLGYDRQTMRNMRCEGRGPKWHKVNGRVRYWLHDLEAWVEECDKATAKRLNSLRNLKGQKHQTDDSDEEGDE
jgi:hypothetical protein